MLKTLNIYYQNVRGLKTKTSTIFRNLMQQDNVLVCFTATWLHGGIFDNEIIDSRYTVYRRDRCYDSRGDSMGGGVLIAVNSNLSVYSSSQISLTNKAADVIKVSIRSFLSDRTASDEEGVCSVFNNYFKSVYKDAPKNITFQDETYTCGNLDIGHIELSVSIVKKYLRALNINKGYGL